MLNVGIIGAAGNAFPYAAAFSGAGGRRSSVVDAAVTWIWSPDRPASDALASELGIGHVADTAAELRELVDLVVFADASRGGADWEELAGSFVRAGIPTFVDALAGTTVAATRNVAELASRTGTALLIASGLRYAVEAREVQYALSGAGDLSLVVVSGPGDWSTGAQHLFELYAGIDDAPLTSVHVHRGADQCTAVLGSERGHDVVFQLAPAHSPYRVEAWAADAHVERNYTDHWASDNDVGAHTYRTRLMQQAAAMATSGVSPVSPAQIMHRALVAEALTTSLATSTTIDLTAARPRTAPPSRSNGHRRVGSPR